jgi:hypothetical protein
VFVDSVGVSVSVECRRLFRLWLCFYRIRGGGGLV